MLVQCTVQVVLRRNSNGHHLQRFALARFRILCWKMTRASYPWYEQACFMTFYSKSPEAETVGYSAILRIIRHLPLSRFSNNAARVDKSKQFDDGVQLFVL